MMTIGKEALIERIFRISVQPQRFCRLSRLMQIHELPEFHDEIAVDAVDCPVVLIA
ncbi:MAG: hypothetical protein ACKO26_16070 [Planctomycetota bacterium]